MESVQSLRYAQESLCLLNIFCLLVCFYVYFFVLRFHVDVSSRGYSKNVDPAENVFEYIYALNGYTSVMQSD